MGSILRQNGITIGSMPPGPLNAITDVAGVRVGQTTLIEGDFETQPEQPVIRTGVTVVLPHGGNVFVEKVPAAVHTINGYGKPVGFEQVRELGQIESPLALTNTLNVGIVMDALVQFTLQRNPQVRSVNVVVAETNDGYLNDIRGRHVQARHVFNAIENASLGSVNEGAFGAGTGTICFGWKGGIGSSSRRLPETWGGFTVGALVQTNFGRSEDLVIDGIPVGKFIQLPKTQKNTSPGSGSVVIILAVDAPVNSRQLQRLCQRAQAGLARTGAQFSHGSGDFVIAFSNAHPSPAETAFPVTLQPAFADDQLMDGLFQGVIECVEEAVLCSLFSAKTTIGREGHTGYALPLEQVLQIWRARR